MNRTNVQRTIDYLRALPTKEDVPTFNMSVWFRTPQGSAIQSVETILQRGHECGTSACLAGHICYGFRDEITSLYVDWGARAFLGLNEDQADELFYGRFRDKNIAPGLDDITLDQVITQLELMLAQDIAS